MSTLSQIEIDTRPAEEAGKRLGERLMRGAMMGFNGNTLADQILNEFKTQAKGGEWSPSQIMSTLQRSMRDYGRAIGMSPNLVAEAINNLERDYKNAKMGSDADMAKFLKHALEGMGKTQGGLLEAVKEKSIDKAVQNLKKQASSVGQRAYESALMSGSTHEEAAKRRVSAIQNFEDDIDKRVIRDSVGSIIEGDTIRNLKDYGVYLDDEKRWHESDKAKQKDKAIAEKQADKESREEQKMINRILTQQDRFYAAQGYKAADRAAALDANDQQYQRQKGVTHKAHMDYLKGELARAKQDNEDLAQDRKDAKVVERLQREARKYAEKVWSKVAQSERMSGGGERSLHTARNLFDTLMENKIPRVGKSLSLYKFREDLNQYTLWQALETIDDEKHGKGYIGTKADLKAYAADVMDAVKRSYHYKGFDTDRTNRLVNSEKRDINQRIRAAVGKDGLEQVRNLLDVRMKDAQSTIEQARASRTLKEEQRKELDTLDELIRKHKDRQRLKNMWEWLPWGPNGKFSDTPGISFGLLRHVPLLGHFGWGGGSLEDDRSDIRRQIKNAKNVNELAAIRQKYQFDERQQVYDRDLERLRKGRSWLWSTRALGIPIRSAEGEYLPSLNKMGESFMRMTNKLATAWIGVMWARMAAQTICAPLIGMMQAADTHTRQKNMYNVSLPYGMTSGKTFEQWEDESFEKARRLRMSASEYRATVMNAAPIFHTAEYGEDYKKGRIGADGRMHYQGERIVTDMAQVERVAENLHMMARISGSSDVEMQAALRQVIQMISKGRGNIQDIRPILESGGHMGDMIARFGFGASGAADLYKLNDKKGLTADKLLTNLLSDKTSDDLRELMRRSARTWEEVAAIMKSDLNKLFLPTIRAFASESEYGLGDRLLGITQSLADNKWIGEAIRDRIDIIIEDLSQRWFDYLRMGLKSLAVVGYIASGVSIVAGTLAKLFGYVTNFVGDFVTTDMIDDRLERLGLDERNYFESPTKHLVDLAMGSTDDPRLKAAIFRKIELTDSDFDKPENIDKILNTIIGFTDSDIDEIVSGFSNWNEDSQLRARNEIRQGIDNAKKIAGTDIMDLLKLNEDSHNLRDTTGKMIDSLVGSIIGGSSWLLEKGLSNDPRELFGVGEGSIEAAVKKMEDERLPGHALDLQNQTAGNTGETAKNTRKANQIQLAILKQVAGTRVVNRVVHVNPNIVSNVGTIRNGIEYDQLLKDLGSTVNHAVTAYAL